MKIHIFNPESDYALASGDPHYTPPAGIIGLRRKMALTPLRWADLSDAILLPDDDADVGALRSGSPDSDSTAGPALLPLSALAGFLRQHPDATIEPWGWNPLLRHMLAEAGAPPEMLPSQERLGMIRRLSHRKNTISFNRLLNDRLEAHGIDRRHRSPLPLEFTDERELMEWEKEHRPAYLKAPWSSSGRGVLYTAGLDHGSKVLPWVRGIIRRQGSVMAETAADKALDFATEWRVGERGGRPHAEFLGVSVFEASFRGKYHSNADAVQPRLMKMITDAAPDFGTGFIEAQREALTELLTLQEGPVYTGFVGIDMLASHDGTIRGGIELNFRRTMGVPPAEICVIGTGNVGTHLCRAFRSIGIDCISAAGRSASFPRAEIYIVCVKDSEVESVCSRIRPPAGAIVAHTSGSIGIEAAGRGLNGADAGYGVFYPLQTFSKHVAMDYSTLPFLIEGSDAATASRLAALARRISPDVAIADSGIRAEYHLAAVLTCNFTNHLCTLADEYLSARGLDFRMLLPLMRQTVAKLSATAPAAAQTGPAARGDMAVIRSHLARLGEWPETASIYRIITGSILDHTNKSESNE